MRKRLVVARLAQTAAILPFILAIGCERTTEPASSGDSSHAKPSGEIVLGGIFPLTGDVASYGKAAQHGIDLAVSEVNAKSGINGRRIKVIYEDSQAKSNLAISAMQKLTSVDKVPLVFGAAASSVSVALCPIANREKVVLISPISSTKELTKAGGPYFFRTCPSDVVQAGMMAKWMLEESHKTAGILFVNNSWGQGLRDEFVERFGEDGGKVVDTESCNEGDRELRTQLSKLKAANPDALYGITYPQEGAAFLRQAKELAIDIPMYGADVWGSPELLDAAGDAADGAKIIRPAKLEGPTYDAFANAFKDRYGQAPDVYASYAYDTAHVVFEALARAERGEALRKAIAETDYTGVTGKTAFDENGDVVGKGFVRVTLP